MRRVPKARDLAKLAELTKAKELAALADLARASEERRAADQHVAELLSMDFQATSLAEASVIAKWRVWRHEELQRRTTRLAAAIAAHQMAARKCGRFVAENSVAERLHKLAKGRDAADADGRSADFTSPAERYR